MDANTVINALGTYHVTRNMNEVTQDRSPIHVSFVKSALTSHHIASNMNELTQEKSHMHANTVKSALAD